MKEEEIKILLIKLVKEHCEKSLEENEIEFKTSLVDDLDYDSLAIVSLLVDIEEKFEISTDNELIDAIDTVDSLFNYIKEKIANE